MPGILQVVFLQVVFPRVRFSNVVQVRLQPGWTCLSLLYVSDPRCGLRAGIAPSGGTEKAHAKKSPMLDGMPGAFPGSRAPLAQACPLDNSARTVRTTS